MLLVLQHGVKRRHAMDILAFIPPLLHLSSRLQKDISSLVLTTKSSRSLLSDCIFLQLDRCLAILVPNISLFTV